MRNLFLSAAPLWPGGLGVLRILTGVLVAYHGLEVFDAAKMREYATWDVFKSLPSPLLLVYIGKGLELVTGFFLALGFLTRIAALLMAVTMLVICFRVGQGRFYYEDQHPFLFALLALVFVFTGSGPFSIDRLLFTKPKTIR
jgi:putative oxidoreductase